MAAYYNELDPVAAEWLRELIRAGAIADGVVDNRSISDVEPYDLKEFRQCHFFAGIGVRSYALRQAGWSDDRRVWTGSCPCQPFSLAGRGGGFADERHLWPHWFHLIGECQPDTVFGEQVASKDGLGWLDLVQADLEGEGYASGSVDLCAAGVGAPHIRQRLFFVAERLADNGGARLAKRISDRRIQHQKMGEPQGQAALSGSDFGGLANHKHNGCGRPQTHETQPSGYREGDGVSNGGVSRLRRTTAGPTNGIWGSVDWLLCRDGKWRPVEPGTFPLAHGAPARVGRLRGYGNAIVAEVARTFISAYMETQEQPQ